MSLIKSDKASPLKLIQEVLNDFFAYGYNGHLIRIVVTPEFKADLDKETTPIKVGSSNVEVLEDELGRLEIAVDE